MSLPGLKVLVVDDNKATRQMVLRTLHQTGLDSLDLRVRAVEIDAVTIPNDKSVNRVFKIFMKHDAHAEVNELARFHHRDRPARRVQ